MTKAACRHANEWILVSSALWGAVHLGDPIPAYRLSGGVTLPRIGTMAKVWRTPLTNAMQGAAASGVVFDLRSGAYAKLWTPHGDLAEHTAVGRVLLQRPDGSRAVVSHHNKSTKGRLVRALVSQTSTTRTVEALADLIEKIGFTAELSREREGKPWSLDVVVDEV